MVDVLEGLLHLEVDVLEALLHLEVTLFVDVLEALLHLEVTFGGLLYIWRMMLGCCARVWMLTLEA